MFTLIISKFTGLMNSITIKVRMQQVMQNYFFGTMNEFRESLKLFKICDDEILDLMIQITISETQNAITEIVISNEV